VSFHTAHRDDYDRDRLSVDARFVAPSPSRHKEWPMPSSSTVDHAVAPPARPTVLSVLVYSDDSSVRRAVRSALGSRPAADLPEVRIHEVATPAAVIEAMDAIAKRGARIDLAILDGEAVPAGGMGIARQLKDEIYHCPPLLVLTGRAQDGWLATWARADAVVPHPLDPVRLADVAASMLREKLG
jgi:CheY-like chemotaxis protein